MASRKASGGSSKPSVEGFLTAFYRGSVDLE